MTEIYTSVVLDEPLAWLAHEELLKGHRLSSTNFLFVHKESLQAEAVLKHRVRHVIGLIITFSVYSHLLLKSSFKGIY